MKRDEDSLNFEIGMRYDTEMYDMRGRGACLAQPSLVLVLPLLRLPGAPKEQPEPQGLAIDVEFQHYDGLRKVLNSVVMVFPKQSQSHRRS